MIAPEGRQPAVVPLHPSCSTPPIAAVRPRPVKASLAWSAVKNYLMYAGICIWLCSIAEPLGAQTLPTIVEHGTYNIHLLLHAIGAEEYTLTQAGPDRLALTVQATAVDRGRKRSSSSILEMDDTYTPLRFEQHSLPARAGKALSAQITGTTAVVHEGDTSRSFVRPATSFISSASMPASVEMMMMRYWERHGRPARLPVLRASEQALPIEIKLVGHEALQSKGRIVRLTRYTVANLVFGREILWLNDSHRIAAVMTFAGGLPQELVLDEYEPVLGQLVHSAVEQEMLDLATLTRAVPPEMQGTYAIVGARLIDGTGAPPLENATVVIRNGRIAAAGLQPAPAGMRVIHAEGESLLPGLWEMHTHYSGVEFGPALLAAGITTARDCGGEFEFLTTVRRKINGDHELGPRLLLAGLIDSGGPLAFGLVNANSPAEGVAAVDVYAEAHFNQIKVYTQLQPDVLKAVASEAHRHGMTVTGHVPAAMDAFEGVADGMDQINHLQFVTQAMLPPGGKEPVDLNSQRAKDLIALLKQREIVVDPTEGWGEMAGHPVNTEVSSFEPGINSAPYTLSAKYKAMGVPASDQAAFQEEMQTDAKVIHALYAAGVPIVAGSDTGLIGYGLDRELELYVQAGMTPMAALQTATLSAARAMKMDAESGTVEVGKRADLTLVRGNPVENISDLRHVVSVVTEGRMYDSKRLAQTVGFTR